MKDETLLPDFDAWSRRCEIQLLLCNREFREVAEFTWNEACRAALQPGNSAQPVTVPAGYVLVPVEPTTNQWAAGMQAFDSGMDKVTRVYKAMLAAAPTTPDGWIPVSERMPEWKSDYRYIPLNLLLNGRTVVQGGFDDGRFWLDGVRISNVTAWQPLPDAPKGV